MRILLKRSRGTRESPSWMHAGFLLKQAVGDPDMHRSYPRNLLICLHTTAPFRDLLCEAFELGCHRNITSISCAVIDPFRIFLIVMKGWYHWNTELFWDLRDSLLGLEIMNTQGDDSFTPGAEPMHLLWKDVIQAVEMYEVALGAVRTMRQLYATIVAKETNEESLDIMHETSFTLDYHCLRYEQILHRINGLVKRMDAQISLVRLPFMMSITASSRLMHLGL